MKLQVSTTTHRFLMSEVLSKDYNRESGREDKGEMQRWKRMGKKEKDGAKEKKFRSSIENFLGEPHKMLLNK